MVIIKAKGEYYYRELRGLEENALNDPDSVVDNELIHQVKNLFTPGIKLVEYKVKCG